MSSKIYILANFWENVFSVQKFLPAARPFGSQKKPYFLVFVAFKVKAICLFCIESVFRKRDYPQNRVKRTALNFFQLFLTFWDFPEIPAI